MTPDLEKLVRLHHVDSALKLVGSQLAAIPLLRQEIDDHLARDGSHLEGAKAALEGSLKARRQNEASVQDLETKRSKYKGQLMEVKTNKEYTAMLHEIEGVEREVREREDQILTEMERAEGLAGDVKREEGLFKSVEEKARTEGQALEAKGRQLQDEHKRLQAARDACAAAVPGDAMELFQRVARLRGVAVAEARDDVCQLCHMKLRPQMYVDLKRNEDIVQCPSCSRILYYVPTAPAVVPTP
jgi:hypothetical protein